MYIPVWKTLWLFGLINSVADFIELFWKLKDRNWTGFSTPLFVVVRKNLKPTIMVEKIRHEKKHVKQWWRYWVIGFLPVYIYQVKKYNYEEAPLEIEAREAESYD